MGLERKFEFGNEQSLSEKSGNKVNERFGKVCVMGKPAEKNPSLRMNLNRSWRV